jgi:general secretion pathway protein G
VGKKRRAEASHVRSRDERGFTLISVMITISIMMILLGMAIPIFSHSLQRAREENLRNNLRLLNDSIFKFTLDRQKAPQSLDELRGANYIDQVPNDITGTTSWEVEPTDGVILSLEQKDPDGIIGVHSGSHQVGSNGVEYSKW